MIINHLPATNQRAEHGVSVDGIRCGEMTGDRLATATALRSAYREQTDKLSAANRDAALLGALSNDALRTLIGRAPRPRANVGPPSHLRLGNSISLCI